MLDYIFIFCIVVIGLILLRNEKEYNYEDKTNVSDYLPWALLLGDNSGIIINKNGSLQKTFRIIGKDLDSSTDVDLVHMKQTLNNVLKRINGNWSLHMEVNRNISSSCIHSKMPDSLSQKFEDIREYTFNSKGEKNFYENSTYLTLTYLPPPDNISGLKDKLIEDVDKKEKNELENLEIFKREINEIYLMLKEIFALIEPLNDKEVLTYLHNSFSQNDKQKIAPINTYLDRYISDTPITTGITPLIGEEYLGVISLLDFPQESYPCLFNFLNGMDIKYRFVTRYIFLDNIEAQKKAESYRKKWAVNRKKFMTAIIDKVLKHDSGEINENVLEREAEAEAIYNQLQNENIGMGYYTFTITLKNKDQEKLTEDIQNIIAKIQGLGFVAIRETIGILPAFFGSLAGDIEHNIRKPLIPTIVLTDLLPMSTIWAGETWNKHLNAPPLLYCTSNSSTPFRLNLHQGDVGHTAIFGQTGGGKSVLLCTIASNFRKYTNGQVIIFDKGGSSRVLTRGLGGKFYDLGKENITFQPLAKIDDPLERQWAFEWLCGIFERENITLTGELKNTISNALLDVSNMPQTNRTMTGFYLSIQNIELKEAIKQFTKDGNLGKYFDGNIDNFNKDNPWQVFEMESLINSKSACSPIAEYIFHKLEVEMFNGSPTLLILDEFWALLDNKQFTDKIKDWLKTLRKKNVSVVFATQELKDIQNSAIRDTILSSCVTKIYLADRKAVSQEMIGIYRSFGLNDREIQLISMATLKRDYFYKSLTGNRLFQLNLSKFELAYYGASDPMDQKQCMKLSDLNIEEFNEKWIEYKGLEEIELLKSS